MTELIQWEMRNINKELQHRWQGPRLWWGIETTLEEQRWGRTEGWEGRHCSLASCSRSLKHWAWSGQVGGEFSSGGKNGLYIPDRSSACRTAESALGEQPEIRLEGKQKVHLEGSVHPDNDNAAQLCPDGKLLPLLCWQHDQIRRLGVCVEALFCLKWYVLHTFRNVRLKMQRLEEGNLVQVSNDGAAARRTSFVLPVWFQIKAGWVENERNISSMRLCLTTQPGLLH